MLPPCPGEAFARLYGLTRGESRVALTLAQCLTLQDVGTHPVRDRVADLSGGLNLRQLLT